MKVLVQSNAKSSRWMTYLLLAFAIIVGFYNACSDVNVAPFTNVESSVLDPNGVFCVNPPQEIGRYTNILFIVDTSGSNVQGNNTGGGGTDPDKSRRAGAMKKFFEKNRSNSYIRWGLEIFGGSVPGGAKHLVVTGENQNFGEASAFDSALNTFQNQVDDNSTPYVAALNLGKDAVEKSIQHSIENNEDPAIFQVIFMSDGVPMPGGQDPEIFDLVKKMVIAADGNLYLSTVYYNVNGDDSDAIGRLQEMAKLGNGKFQNASHGEAINIDELIVGGKFLEPYFIRDLFVYNLNSAVCDDGIIKADSDADGICDEDEIRYNEIYASKISSNSTYSSFKFDPYNRYSFDRRFSDLFMYKYLIDGEMLPGCDNVPDNFNSDKDSDLLNVCEEKFLYSKTPQGPTVDWTNNMKKNGNRGSETNFDTDGDGIIDSLEFFFFKNKGFALNFNSANDRINSKTQYELFKNHISPLRPETSVSYDINVRWVKKNAEGLNCYHIDQAALPVYRVKQLTAKGTGGGLDLVHAEDESVIMVYYTMTTENDPEGKGVMRYSFQKVRYQDNGAVIDLNKSRFDEAVGK